MGIWDFINSTVDTVKQNAPNLTPVKDACRTSYDYSSDAVAKIDNAVRVNGLQRLKLDLPDDEARAKIGLFVTKFAKNAADYATHEGIKLVPGGMAASKILSNTFRDVEDENLKSKESKAVQNKKPEDVIAEFENLKSKKSKAVQNQKPEDVIADFMMMEFVGNRIFDGLMVPEISRGKKHE